ncbi:multicopper oxidase-domain-containing protein [Hysterangium stoloniferum]|nr:multicopper oxidase-domain-containing protein [Hysterangium stoloniferum]
MFCTLSTLRASGNAWFAGGPEPVPDSGLINAAGRFQGGPAVDRTGINVTKGLRYRFRIIGLSAKGFFEFAISNHLMTVIESDGIETQPYVVDSIPVLPGQRYSVVGTPPHRRFLVQPRMPTTRIDKPPSVPTLLNILANGATNDPSFGPNENTFTLQSNAIIEVSFIGGTGHAFHLHGHAFDVIQSASGGGPNFIDPPRPDVVASGGTVDQPVRIRFRTDNPGIQSGPQSIQPNEVWRELCNIYIALDPSLQ